jgi:hypothetical protein
VLEITTRNFAQQILVYWAAMDLSNPERIYAERLLVDEIHKARPKEEIVHA